MSRVARVLIVPGLAVRGYAAPPAQALAALGHRVDLLPAPAWRGEPSDLAEYGKRLAEQIAADDAEVDLLIGLSVGTQAAAVAAAHSAAIRRLLLVGPTLAPRDRSRVGAYRRWRRGEPHRDGPGVRIQAPDWVRAGLPKIYRGMVSALQVRLEDELAGVKARVTILHPDSDLISPLDFAVSLADRHRARLLILPDAPHSWPIGDHDRFCGLVTELLAEPAP